MALCCGLLDFNYSDIDLFAVAVAVYKRGFVIVFIIVNAKLAGLGAQIYGIILIGRAQRSQKAFALANLDIAVYNMLVCYYVLRVLLFLADKEARAARKFGVAYLLDLLVLASVGNVQTGAFKIENNCDYARLYVVVKRLSVQRKGGCARREHNKRQHDCKYSSYL